MFLCSSNHDSSKNMAARGGGGGVGVGGGAGLVFPKYIYIENFKNLLVRNHWTNFSITWQESLFGDPLPNLFKLS